MKNAQGCADRFAGHAARRAARTNARAAVGADEQCESDIAEGSEEDVAGASADTSLDEDVPGAPRDPYVNPDEFKETHSRQKPAGFSTAVRQAREIHIDHMRVLLEAHYDEAHKQRWAEQHPSGRARGPPGRKADKLVFRSVMEYHLSKSTADIELPDSIKAALQSPKDEHKWQKLEDVRLACALYSSLFAIVELAQMLSRDSQKKFGPFLMSCLPIQC